jgi:hypothetical protein
MTANPDARRIRYQEIRKELPMRSLKRAFTRGNGGKLAFVWVLGAGILLTVLANPLLAGAFTAACAVLAVPITRDELRNEAYRRELIDQVIAERLAADTVHDPELGQEIARTRRTLTEMASRIARAEDRGRTDTPLEQVFADATELAFLQRESAEQAEDLDRIVDFVVSNDAGRGASTGRPSGAPDELRNRNLKAVLEEAKAARAMVATIGGQLDTMLLQGFQIERDTVDVVRAENAATESHEAVARLQDVVDARRRAAARLGELFTPEGETSARA